MNPLQDTHALLAHVGWVRSLAAQLVRDGAAAEDLAQETLLAAWQRPPRDPSALRGYLGSVLRNLLRRGARDADRREARERGSARTEALPSAADTAERLATHRQIVAAVEALAEPYRTVVLLRYFEELPPRRIAEHLGVPVKTVETRLTRGHALLRERLDADHGGDRRAWAVLLARFAGSEPIGRAEPGTHGPATPSRAKPWLLATGAVAAAGVVAVVLLARTAWMRAEREMHAARVAEIEATHALSRLRELEVSGERAPIAPPEARALLRGRVRSSAGAAIAGAEVTASFRPSDGTRLGLGAFGEEVVVLGAASSSGDGTFAIELPAGRIVEVRVRAARFGVARRPLVDPASDLDVVLDPAATLSVAVVDGGGAAVANARVRLFVPVEPQSALEPILDGRTDALGRWRSSEVPPGVFWIEVGSASGPALRVPNVVVRSGETVDRELRLNAGVEVAGTVRDARSKAAVAGARVRFSAVGESLATTDDQGRFRITGLDQGAAVARIGVAAPGYAAAEVAVDPRRAPIPPVEVELVRGFSVAGRLRGASGDPVGGAWVAAYGHVKRATITPTDWIEARTDATGAFVLEALRPDLPHALVVRSPGLETLVRRIPESRDGERVELGDVVLAAGASIEGRVLRDDGAPAAGAVVHLEREDASVRSRSEAVVTIGADAPGSAAEMGELDWEPLFTRDAIAGDDGSFRVIDLEAGIWSVVARIGYQRCEPREVELAAGEVERDVDLRIPRGLAIEGRVVDDADRPLPGAWVLLFRKGGRLEERAVETDVEGRFRMEGLEAIPYRLSAGRRTSGAESFGRTESEDLVPPQLDVVLRLARTPPGG